MSAGPRLGKITEFEFQSAEMPVGSGRREGGRARRQREAKRENGRSRPVLYPSEMFIGGIGLQWPHSPVLGGILGNVVFCWNMVDTCSTYSCLEWIVCRNVMAWDTVYGRVGEAQEQQRVAGSTIQQSNRKRSHTLWLNLYRHHCLVLPCGIHVCGSCTFYHYEHLQSQKVFRYSNFLSFFTLKIYIGLVSRLVI